MAFVDAEQKTAYLAPADVDNFIGLSNGNGTTTRVALGSIGAIIEQAFQYWPSDVSDSSSVGWEFEQIPGGSHPLAHWTSSGERTISFTAQFSRDVHGKYTPDDFATGNVPDELVNDIKHNPDLRAVAKWLKWFRTPLYNKDGRVIPPSKLYLVMPGLQLGDDGSDDLLVVMTSCEISYKDFWPDGSPRRMDASLAFVEIVQQDGKVNWIGRDTLERTLSGTWSAADYKMTIIK